jgi:hypothetical protein
MDIASMMSAQGKGWWKGQAQRAAVILLGVGSYFQLAWVS